MQDMAISLAQIHHHTQLHKHRKFQVNLPRLEIVADVAIGVVVLQEVHSIEKPDITPALEEVFSRRQSSPKINNSCTL
jgi:hypothetical protein